MNDSYRLPTRSLVKNDSQSMIERPDIQRSRFLTSFTHNTTFDAGYLIPFLVEEVLPGDMLKYDVTAYVRMATPLFPMFDNQKIDTFFFFVPNRIIYDRWVNLMGEQVDPDDSIDFLAPIINSDSGGGTNEGFPRGSLGDYFGLPVEGSLQTGAAVEVSALPFRAYSEIWNQWFRDQNLQDSVKYDKGGSSFNLPSLVPLKRSKMHDYFTSCLPFPQKFDAPTIPMLGKVYVDGIGSSSDAWGAGPENVYQSTGSENYPFWQGSGNYRMRALAATGLPDVFVDLANSVEAGIDINQFRQTLMIQQLLERDARGGTRYTELLRAHFGVMPQDMRLQRPEYIGGGSTPLQLTPIAQTAPTAGLPVGALGAAGTSVGQHRASYAATEHGFIIGLINVQSELSYQQGIHRMWKRRTRYDYYWPALAHLGEQAVLNEEIYARGNVVDDFAVFGYQERWHEYRTRTSFVTGQFRSNVPGTLDAWHLSQNFASLPALGPTFIEDTPPMARVLAAGELAVGQQYLANILIRRDATRPIPVYGTPAGLGRF